MNKIIALVFSGLLIACSSRKAATTEEQTSTSDSSEASPMNMYAKDRLFLQQHHADLVELELGNARALICPAYQGRVMTTTADGQTSYGWINYELIKSGKLLPHMNAFGGEDRFWLGPEGGQYALYFKKGDPFDGDHWQTPAAIDSEPFDITDTSRTSATFARTVSLTNYSGTHFDIGIERTVKLLDKAEIEHQLAVDTHSLKVVGIQSDNVITNKGKQAWVAQTGMPSIWILGMMNASPESKIIVPYREGDGQPVNDAYFGKVPADRLQMGKTAALFKADAKYRSKIGVSPARATNWIGSYDSATKTLTLVTYDFDPKDHQYVNSAWEHQKDPFSGDVINAYNDGPMKPGQPQMGHFYELESSSPAANLVPGAKRQHRHTTFHLQGSEQQLNELSKRLLFKDLASIN
ncbi:hypothetical protein EXU85_07760 [Spirosoma sp. KCTC 42546]|uniref:DUF6786 family protein n=1 Tax=Spirosoma sp. KCTC 42546 TaxID=2520506 RepID=UPI00115AF35D|nr:DUF6786 family protein [Spirosoma sp. KCTC 42546]QDK78509.1 hypothetical protein EXU85_07760 [Spirosoma sp. KCTC 42546]